MEVPMQLPDVSIVITCGPGYERWVPFAIMSAMRQRSALVTVEVIVLFDNNKCVLSEVPGVRYFNVCFGNVSKTRHRGLQVSNGKAILFLDADDTLPDNFVATAYQQLQEATAVDPRTAGIYPDVLYYDMDQKTPPVERPAAAWSKDQFERENFIVISTLTWAYALMASWQDWQPTQLHSVNEDYLMWSYLVQAGWVFVPGRNFKLIVGTHADSLSRLNVSDQYHVRYAVADQPVTAVLHFEHTPGHKLVEQYCDWLAGLQGLGIDGRLCVLVESYDAVVDDWFRSSQDVGMVSITHTQPPPALRIGTNTAHIRNQLIQTINTPYTLLLPADTVPDKPVKHILQTLAAGFQNDVSGVVATRYKAVADGFSDKFVDVPAYLGLVRTAALRAAPQRVQSVNINANVGTPWQVRPQSDCRLRLTSSIAY